MSGSGEVGLMSGAEENKGKGGPSVDPELEFTVVEDLPKTSISSFERE